MTPRFRRGLRGRPVPSDMWASFFLRAHVALVATAILAAVSCRGEKRAPGEARDAGDAAAVATAVIAREALVGCAVIRRAGEAVVCEAQGPVALVDDSGADSPAPALVVDAGASTPAVLSLRGAGDAGGGEMREVRVLSVAVPAWLAQTRALRSQGQFDAADAASDPRAAPGDTERALRLGQRARNSLARGRVDDATRLFEDAVVLHEREGRWSDAADDSFALAFALAERSHSYARARRAVATTSPWVTFYPEGRARQAYYAGVIASETGDVRSAVRLLSDAANLGARYRMRKLTRDARVSLALTLAQLGRDIEAERTLSAVATDSESDGGCATAEALANLSYHWLSRPDADVSRALDFARRSLLPSCEDAAFRTTALGNLGAAQVRAGEISAAQTTLAELRKKPATRMLDRLLRAELEGRVALASGNARGALARFDEQCALADLAALDDAMRSCQLGRGEALEAMGRTSDAVAAWQLAENALDRETSRVPLGQGRTTFLSERLRPHELLIDALVKLRRFEEALAEAHRPDARAWRELVVNERMSRLDDQARIEIDRAVAAFEAKRAALEESAATDWTLPVVELAKRNEGLRRARQETHRLLDEAMAVAPTAAPARAERTPPELLRVAVLRGERNTYFVVMSARGASVQTAENALPRGTVPEAWARALEEHLVGAERVVVFSEVDDIDVHAIAVRGVPLGVLRPTTYALRYGAATSAFGAPALASVLADARSNLASVRDESELVARTLLDRGFDARAVPASDLTVIRDSFARSAVLHFAGHASFSPDEDGLESGLTFGASRFTVADVLALPRAPFAVVLSACDAGRSDRAHGLAGFSFALLGAGTTIVVAPTRKVSDEGANAFAHALYETWPRVGDGTVALGRAMQHAYEKTRGGGRDDWTAFRAFTRGW